MNQEAIDKLTKLGTRLASLSDHATCPDCRTLSDILAEMLLTAVEVAVEEALEPQTQGEPS